MIKIWNKIDFGHIFKEKEAFLDKLSLVQNKIQKEGYHEWNRETKLTIMSDLHDIISKEEKFWRQRSRIKWLLEGVQNTSFFHLSTLKHKAHNRIESIKKGSTLLSEEKDIMEEVVSFFSSLLAKDSSLLDLDQKDMLACIPHIIQPHQNKTLISIPKEEEIK